LNENVERPTQIWNVDMREELLEFSKTQDQHRTQLLCENDLKSADMFSFSALRNELCVDGVYVRVFCKCAVIVDVENPSKFGKALLFYLREVLSSISDGNGNRSARREIFAQLSDIEKGHVDIVVEALRVLTDAAAYVVSDIAIDEENLVSAASILPI
jgi:hypothetical protein